MLIINTVYDLLSIITFVVAIWIAVLAALRLITRFYILDNPAEYLYIILLAFAIAWWAFQPLLDQLMETDPMWKWLSLLGLALALSLYFVSVSRESLPPKSNLTWLLAILILLIIPYFSLYFTKWSSPVWTLIASFVTWLVFAVNTFQLVRIAVNIKDRLYTVISVLLLLFTVLFALGLLSSLLFESNYLVQLFNSSAALFLVLALSFSATDRTYLKSMVFMNAKVEQSRLELAAQMENIEDVVISLARTIDAKDKYTEGHTERVSQYAVFLGERLSMSDRQLETLRIGALIHDLGKIGIDLNILNKPGKLTDEEFEQIRLHPALGQQICSPLKALQEVGDIIRHHHEKLDGSGYPDGLCGEQISLNARIVSIVDIFDALTTERSYRAALPVTESLLIMKEEAAQGKLDSQLLKEFEALLYDLGVIC